MSQEYSTDRVIKFRKALSEIFAGENGNIVIEFLQQSYVDVPAIDEKPELTYYRLGQKEFVQGLIRDAQSDYREIEKMLNGGTENVG